MNKWEKIATQVIETVIEQAKEEGMICGGKVVEFKKKEFISKINASYPFGERKYTPYKIWLSVRKTKLYLYGCYKSLK